MRKFHSYEDVDPDIHYYVPRGALIEQAYQNLAGEKPERGGHTSLSGGQDSWVKLG